MDIIKFIPQIWDNDLTNAEILNNLTSVTWVERYREPGEFTIEADLSSGIMDELPLGTLISHTNTLEVMIVENHEIKEKTKEDPTIIVTGRSYVSFLENRMVGTDWARFSTAIFPYNLFAQYTHWQIRDLINDHISAVDNAGDILIGVTSTVEFYLGLSSGTVAVARTIDPGNVLDAVIELLEIDDLGIKTVRRNVFAGGAEVPTYFLVYKGAPRQADVMFSWKEGDLDSLNYLFSQKKRKTSAYVAGTYTHRIVDLAGYADYNRRMMYVDAKDIDGHMDKTDSFAGLATTFQTRGLQELAKQVDTNITQADVSDTSRYTYRKDYGLGDLVTVDGNYGEIAVMRVVEYAEIQDENGQSGHPTLAIPTSP